MARGKNRMKPGDYAQPYRVTDGRRFRLKDFDPGETKWVDSKDEAQALLAAGVRRLCELQEMLYAQDRWAVLVIFQAMDAAGKDSTIKHVMSGINPQGCQVYAFKAPSANELDHDFLWRTTNCLPERGRIGIFNRSYYEETLVVRVHHELLEKERLPVELIRKDVWKQRFKDIGAFERYLAHNGVVVLKFFLHVSKKVQKARFLERLKDPAKNWKFSVADLHERERFDDYMKAYEDTIRHTASNHAPWFVVPADHKWFTRLVVASAMVDALEGLNLHFPKVSPEQRRELERVRRVLEGNGRGRRARR
jgi:PPK2 family polyphosphate:nucleotide phosphotransferase